VNVFDEDGIDNRSTNSIQLWNYWTHIINTNVSGTILQIKCSPRVSTELNNLIETSKLQKKIAKQYYRQIQNNTKIYLNGTVIEAIDYLDRLNATHIELKTYPIRVLDNKPTICSFRTYQSGVIKHTRLVQNGKRWKFNNLTEEELNVEPIGEIVITTTFDLTWIGNAYIVYGGQYFVRGDKMVKYFESDKVISGDHRRRPIIEAARHQIEFNSELDDIFGVLINKSDLRKDIMDSHIINGINFITCDYMNTLYKDHYRVVPLQAGGDGIIIEENNEDNNEENIMMERHEIENMHANDDIDATSAQNEPIIPQTSLGDDIVNVEIEQTNVIVVIPPPPVIVLGLRFSIESRPRILSIEDETLNMVIARIKTYGEGAAFRKWLCAKLRVDGRESFLEFMNTTPSIFTTTNYASNSTETGI